jgi:hypothetical protein
LSNPLAESIHSVPLPTVPAHKRDKGYYLDCNTFCDGFNIVTLCLSPSIRETTVRAFDRARSTLKQSGKEEGFIRAPQFLLRAPPLFFFGNGQKADYRVFYKQTPKVTCLFVPETAPNTNSKSGFKALSIRVHYSTTPPIFSWFRTEMRSISLVTSPIYRNYGVEATGRRGRKGFCDLNNSQLTFLDLGNEVWI